MAANFELLEHTSDIGVLARGSSRQEALIGASIGLSSILVNAEAIRAVEERRLQASGPDEAAQIVDWLNEIIFCFDAEGMVFTEFTIDRWTSETIDGHARGERFDPERHEFRTAVKAATYHQFQIRQIPEGWEIRFFVDV